MSASAGPPKGKLPLLSGPIAESRHVQVTRHLPLCPLVAPVVARRGRRVGVTCELLGHRDVPAVGRWAPCSILYGPTTIETGAPREWAMGDGREHVSERFERLLDLYRKSDGSEWGGQDLENATGGAVTRSYVANLKKGRIENPGLAKLEAVSDTMGFPPALWFGDAEEQGRAPDEPFWPLLRTSPSGRYSRRPSGSARRTGASCWA